MMGSRVVGQAARFGALVVGLAFACGPWSAANAVQASSLMPAGNGYAPFHPALNRERTRTDSDDELVREKRRRRRIKRVLRRARRFIGKRTINIDGRNFIWDCAHYLRAAFFHEFDILIYKGAPKTNSGVRLMWYFAKRRGGIHFRKIPEPGDLIYFHQSYDANRNRKADDFYTHVAIVERVDKYGTITYLDRAINGIARRRMNLFFPNRTRHPETKRLINSYLRPRRRWDEKDSKHLSAQLFAGFGTVIR